MTCLLFILALLFSLPLFAKSNDLGNNLETPNQQAQIFISKDATLYNNGNIKNVVIKETNKTENAPVKGEIFVVNGAVVYNVESLYNAKVTKLVTTENPTIVKRKSLAVEKENAIPKKYKVKEIKQKSYFTYRNPSQNSDVFSQNQKTQIVFSQNRTEYFSKVLISLAFIYFKHFTKDQKLTSFYKNPTINVCHFSGKHSVRPPTYFS